MGSQQILLDGIEETREYGPNMLRYDHDPSRVDGLLAQKTGSGKGYFITDALGSVYGVVDSTGAEVSKYAYDVYGARTAATEGMTTSWGFTGRRHDSSTEMYHRARYLDGGGGAFLSSDPVGRMRGTFGLYEYAMARPTMLVDWSGQWSLAPESGMSYFGPASYPRKGRMVRDIVYWGIAAEVAGRMEQALKIAAYALAQPACLQALTNSGKICTNQIDRERNDLTFYYWEMSKKQQELMGDTNSTKSTFGITLFDEAANADGHIVSRAAWVALTQNAIWRMRAPINPSTGERPYRDTTEAAAVMIHEFTHVLTGDPDEKLPEAVTSACNWPVQLGWLVETGVL